MENLPIAPATPREEAACLALLPEIWGHPAEILAARLDGVLVGAAGMLWEARLDPIGAHVHVHVLPDWRRRGIGRALLAACAALVEEAEGVWTLDSIDEASPAADFVRASGFAASHRTHYFRVDVQAILTLTNPIVERLRRHNRIPANTRLIALRDAPLADVARLAGQEFGQTPLRVFHGLRAGLADEAGRTIDFDTSLIVMEGDAVAGGFLFRHGENDPIANQEIVAPAWRGSYVHPLQLQAVAANVLATGATTVTFQCDEDVRDTMNVARRAGGEPLYTTAHFYRPCRAAAELEPI